MNVTFSARAWYEYTGWQLEDRKTLKRINDLIRDIMRNGKTRIGKPEPLRGWEGYWSRRIDKGNRLVYKQVGEGEEQRLLIAQCSCHYEQPRSCQLSLSRKSKAAAITTAHFGNLKLPIFSSNHSIEQNASSLLLVGEER